MDHTSILFGLETEIGIIRDSSEPFDPVADSIALVRSAPVNGVWMCWDYGQEDPHADMRGFRVPELRQDADEAQYYAQDLQRDLSRAEIKSDLVLPNGARFYNDHAHPEYCTPECSTLAELVAHDRAGERILMACAEELSRQSGTPVRLYKNNTDFSGHSYGCHENYLLPRALPWAVLAEGIQAFLVTRQIYAGAGKFAYEAEDEFIAHAFQVSQRSDFFSELQSVDTMQRRPIINTRDEPHANPSRFRRFHVILGDANMSAFATRLKVGATALTLEALVRRPQAVLPQLADPLGALKAISRDPSFRWEVTLASGERSTALEIQREYWKLAVESCALTPEKEALLNDWKTVLDDLAEDYRRCEDRLDWVAKLRLIGDFRESEKLSHEDPRLLSLDLEYHRLDLAEGLYYALERGGRVRGGPEEAVVQEAMRLPPSSTRAWIRGQCVRKFAGDVLSAQWDYLTLRGERAPLQISLADLFAPEAILRYAKIVEKAGSPDDLRPLINS